MASTDNTGDSPGALRGSSVSNKASEVASQVKSKAADLGHAVADSIDGSRGAAAQGLTSAAGTLHQRADRLPGGQRVAGFAHQAADKLNSTADYIRNHDVDAVIGDVRDLLKNNPGPAMLGAAVVGFLLGRAFSSND